MMRVLYLIPARGGSKGVVGKNLRLVGGIPLVGRAARTAVAAARQIGGSFRVVCSTDDPTIAKAAQEWGAETPFVRPEELASDGAPTVDVVLHALESLGESFGAVVLLQPTSPLTEVADVAGALKLFRSTGAPVISVCRAEHPVEWLLIMDAEGHLESVPLRERPLNRQSARSAYRPNGAVFIAAPEQIRRNRGFHSPEARGFEMPVERSIDIDAELDLETARCVLASRPVPCIEISGRKIGPGQPCFVIAEAGVNHNGSLDLALRLVDAAAAAGADAVKFQVFKAEKVVSPAAPKARYQEVNAERGESQLEMVKKLELSAAQHRQIQAHCVESGILYLSSAFDEGSVDLLRDMGVPAVKVGSGELTNHDLLRYLASLGLPVLLSTGMSSMKEVDDALEVVRETRAPVALLHCVSNYPSAPADCNLAAMQSMRDTFSVPVGWSDHTLGIHVSVAAAARGAALIEKHFTLDKQLPGPDHGASLDPRELQQLVKSIREVEASIGSGEKVRQQSEADTAAVARRSIHAARAIPEGRLIVREDVVLLRPGTGIPANQLAQIIGRRTKRSVKSGAALSPDDLE